MKNHCDICNYTAGSKFNYKKHLDTKSHSKKVVEKTNETILKPIRNINETKSSGNKKVQKHNYNCNFCQGKYSTASSLARHMKVCSMRNDLELLYEQKMKELENELNYHKKINEMYKQENDHLKILINNAGSIVKTSVSALSFVVSKYKTTPPLEKLKDYSLLYYDAGEEEINLIDTIIYNYENNLLADYLGNIIVRLYKKDDPKDQSLWNTDTSRLTYLVRELIDKKMDWVVDKRGIKITKCIIDPMLEYIKTILTEYIDELSKGIRKNSIKNIEIKMRKMKISAEIINEIKENHLSEQINKYIAPHFYLSKNNDELVVIDK
ncbi:hypothetical protein Indivirus_7_20 [Indivirus ILV1]|uniref:C2H2-type domain-containing protein n=1 Tax=Indivirus ILV1 TaxID=1977633 RepID=A0A1V0SEF4_9VIRU|nr:hypothetical protein Indivirus_7_20 [Indivirus ILV1]